MSEWKVGDLLVSKVTSYATVYQVTKVERENGRQIVTIAIDGREMHGRFTSSLFELWINNCMDDTRSYLDAITSDVERTENEKVP